MCAQLLSKHFRPWPCGGGAHGWLFSGEGRGQAVEESELQMDLDWGKLRGQGDTGDLLENRIDPQEMDSNSCRSSTDGLFPRKELNQGTGFLVHWPKVWVPQWHEKQREKPRSR